MKRAKIKAPTPVIRGGLEDVSNIRYFFVLVGPMEFPHLTLWYMLWWEFQFVERMDGNLDYNFLKIKV